MNINQKLAALLLVSAGLLSTQAAAHESGLEKIVANLVSNAVNSVTVEIDQQVQKITLNASNLGSFDASTESVGKVTITDLASAETKTSEKNSEKVSSDD